MRQNHSQENVVILTNNFPFRPGEPFFENEVYWWSVKSRGCSVWLFPSEKGRGEAHDVDPPLRVYSKWSQTRIWRRAFLGFRNMPIQLLIEELKILVERKRLSVKSVLSLCLSCMKTGYHYYTIKRFIEEYGNISTIYCYWNNERSYAASLLKSENVVGRVVSRIHGYDLYEDRKPKNYMPLKSQLIGNFDEIYPLSRQGAQYLQSRYGADLGKIFIAPLGVVLPELDQIEGRQDDSHFFLLSVANCVPVKRIDRIVAALTIASSYVPHVNFMWTHIGGGPLLSSLERHASDRLSSISNVSFEFKGELINSDVRAYYLNNRVDVFVNSSDSEGVPVAIMEAMSFGIPVIAPDVGGVSELVNDDTGWLIPHGTTDEQLGEFIVAAVTDKDIYERRENARRKIEESYNACENYPKFVEHLINSSIRSVRG